MELRDLDPSAESALNEQIADALRAAIGSGQLSDGDRVPGENVLMSRYGVARWTARAALDALVSEGLIIKVPNVGTFVRARPHIQRIGMERYARSRWLTEGLPILGGEAASQGTSASRVILELAEVQPPASVAERLDTPGGEPVWVRRRLVSIEERPHQLADSYYPLDIANGTTLMEQETGTGGDFGQLHQAGHSPSTIREEWSARMPTRAESEALDLPTATPVLELIRTIRDQNERPVEVMLSVIAADTTSLVYEFPVLD
ncbi:MAG: GntR family transcriptional regulator [Nocardioides sp.]